MKTVVQKIAAWIGVWLKAIPFVLGLLGLAFVIAWISGVFNEKIQPGESQPDVRKLGSAKTDQVHEISKEYIEEAVGTLKAASRSVVSAKILATVQEIHVSAGDFVEADDLLVTLNTRELGARLSQADEGLAAAKAATHEAKSDYERNLSLLKSNAISQQEFDIAERKLNVARADERRSEQAVNEAKVLLSYSKIVATKSGRIVDRTVEPGDTVQPGQPILTLYDSRSLRLETPVLEDLAVKLKIGQELNVRVDSIQRDFAVRVDEIVPQADAASRSFLVKTSLPRNVDLYEGMYGRLQIPAGSRRHLCLALTAIRRIGQLEFVDVVLENETLQRRLIRTGRMGMNGRVEVLSGLDAGEVVVIRTSESTPGGRSRNEVDRDQSLRRGDR